MATKYYTVQAPRTGRTGPVTYRMPVPTAAPAPAAPTTPVGPGTTPTGDFGVSNSQFTQGALTPYMGDYRSYGFGPEHNFMLGRHIGEGFGMPAFPGTGPALSQAPTFHVNPQTGQPGYGALAGAAPVPWQQTAARAAQKAFSYVK